MSGDGLLHELLNGLASREDWETVLALFLMDCFFPTNVATAVKASNVRFGKISPLDWFRVAVEMLCIAVFCINLANILMMRWNN